MVTANHITAVLLRNRPSSLRVGLARGDDDGQSLVGQGGGDEGESGQRPRRYEGGRDALVALCA
jgi:hypothetical protein